MTLASITNQFSTLALDGFFRDMFFRSPSDSDVGGGTWGIDSLYMFIWWLGVGFFVPMMIATFYFAWKYRRKPGVAPEPSPSHNTFLEITWSVVPTLFLVVLFFWGYNGYLRAQTPEGHAERADLEGYKWNWELVYDSTMSSTDTAPLGSKADVPVFYMPAGKPVLLRMSSRDVIHSFWVPDFRTKLDVMPNRYTPYSFTSAALDPDDPRVQTGDIVRGEKTFENVKYRDHWIFCAEYCGDSHSEMAAVLRLVEPEVFEEWKLLAAYSAADNPVSVGEIVYKAKGCNTCHSVDGSGGTGPTWLNAYGQPVPFADGTELSQAEIDADPLAWDAYVRESILYPAAKIHAGYANQMPSYDGRLSRVEIRGLIAYMRSLSGNADIETENIPGYEDLDEAAAAADTQANAETSPAGGAEG